MTWAQGDPRTRCGGRARKPRACCAAWTKGLPVPGSCRAPCRQGPGAAMVGGGARSRASAPRAWSRSSPEHDIDYAYSRQPWVPLSRAVPGIEPGTSRTRSENHATRPNSQMLASVGGLGSWKRARAIQMLEKASRSNRLSRRMRYGHQWSSGRIHRCHGCDPGSIPG